MPNPSSTQHKGFQFYWWILSLKPICISHPLWLEDLSRNPPVTRYVLRKQHLWETSGTYLERHFFPLYGMKGSCDVWTFGSHLLEFSLLLATLTSSLSGVMGAKSWSAEKRKQESRGISNYLPDISNIFFNYFTSQFNISCKNSKLCLSYVSWSILHWFSQTNIKFSVEWDIFSWFLKFKWMPCLFQYSLIY